MKKLLYASLAAALLWCCQSKKAPEAGTENMLPFQKWALTPPMGWNSWDCFGPTVVEDEVKANADYMAKNLKKYGWEYIVIDIRWYIENDKAGGYNEKDARYVMDEYGRYQPAVNRFPSADGGKGFKPIADYIHGKGLKFGIHIMRGIPVLAVKQNTPVLGTNVKAQDIYSPEGQCGWLRDNYTVDSKKEGAQAYYNSLFQLYASWGLDFVKVDDLSGSLPEIEMVRKAIDNCGRPIVFSISPGGSQTSNSEFLFKNANMWRTTGDFWDNWPQMKPQFYSCASWASHTGDGHFADADMLPLGKIGIRAERGEPRMSGFTKDEQYSLMTLWAMFRSPLMFGGDLPSNDEFTLSLITNKDILYVNQHGINGKQLFRENDLIAWTADDRENGDKFLAFFNAQDQNPIDAEKAIWKSEVITQDTPGQSVDVDIDITGAKKLFLAATFDEGPRSSHNADWIEPMLIAGKKTIKLTDLKWVKASASHGEPIINGTARNGKLTVDGKEYQNGINANATSLIEYDLPEGATRFKVKAALDNGATASGFGLAPAPSIPGQPDVPDLSAGNQVRRAPRGNSARFLVFVQDPTGVMPADKTEISVKFDQLGLTGPQVVKDLWTGEKLGEFTGDFKRIINRHGCGLYRISSR